MAAQGAALQNHNNELVRCIEDLREKRLEIDRQIREDEQVRASRRWAPSRLLDEVGEPYGSAGQREWPSLRRNGLCGIVCVRRPHRRAPDRAALVACGWPSVTRHASPPRLPASSCGLWRLPAAPGPGLAPLLPVSAAALAAAGPERAANRVQSVRLVSCRSAARCQKFAYGMARCSVRCHPGAWKTCGELTAVVPRAYRRRPRFRTTSRCCRGGWRS